LRKLERKWGQELAVVGVHSPKFLTERDTHSVREAILRLNVGHPVVNDRDFQVWQAYAVRAWPTLMFIDPLGRVIGKHEGEFRFEPFDHLVAEMIAEFDGAGVLDRRPLELAADAPAPEAPLRYPGKVLADEATGQLFVIDSGHNRIVIADLAGRVRRVIGRGAAGLDDGPPEAATFNQPQGLALDGQTLFVADTENHAVRAVDLASGVVTTIAGTGEQLMGERVGGRARQTPLSSPWDLAVLDGTLYVAMAGTHQIWALALGPEALTGNAVIAPRAGNGAEALVDGPRAQASMNQPSGLAADGRRLWIADSEASAIRTLDPGPDGTLDTILGEGLFEFGDADGVGPANVRLQHPLGVLWYRDTVWIADTYNHKIKRLDPERAECRTVAGAGEAGHADGAPATARFSEPSGLAAAAGRLWIADTNNGAIRTVDVDSGVVATVKLEGLEPPPTR
jgi:sugar lactone lactonase YvrE